MLSKQHNYFRSFKSTWAIVFLVSILTWQCKKEDAPASISGICPVVISTDPANGATNVVTNKKVSVTFNEPMDAATITAATFMLKEGSSVIGGTITYSGSTAVFTPTSTLKANTVYTGIVTTAVKDVAKNALISDYIWSFNTGNTPIIVSTDPANSSTNVQLNKLVTATFSTAMDPLSINATTFLLKQGNTAVAGVVKYTGMVATFTPAVAFTPNTVYTGTITNTVKDLAGNTMTNNYVWSFATGTGVAPTVISTDPANSTTNVALNKIIKANFSTAMDPATITGTSFTVSQGVNPVGGVVTYNGTTATFTPNTALLINTVYTCTITTAAKDALGNALANNYTWTFTTTGANPTVILTDPLPGATSVPINKVVKATFSTTMDATTINVLSFLLTQGGNQVFGTVTYAGTTASFTPAANLLNSTLYTATITTAAKDAAGNTLLTNYIWRFTTIGPAPTVISTDPTQVNEEDSHVVFNVNNAEETLESWSIEMKDDQNKKQYYGPYTMNKASVPANTILGNTTQGNYAVKLTGKTKNGNTITKDGYVSLTKIKNPKNEGLRYSILFDFDKSTTIASYEKFLVEVVAPLIPDNSTVLIHGHTDIIGDALYNKKLSTERATSTQKILENALMSKGRKNVKFDAIGYGENREEAPFDNALPEERFYNRTVIIDIIPNK